MTTDELISSIEAARRLDVDVTELYRLITAGELEGEWRDERLVVPAEQVAQRLSAQR